MSQLELNIDTENEVTLNAGGNLRTVVTDPTLVLSNGATAIAFHASTQGHVLNKPILVGRDSILPFVSGCQKLKSHGQNETNLGERFHVFPSSDRIRVGNGGIANFGVNGSSGTLGHNVPYSVIANESFHLAQGTLIGNDELELGNSVGLGDYYMSGSILDNVSIEDVHFSYTGSSVINGPNNGTVRPITDLLLPTGGTTTSSGFNVADQVGDDSALLLLKSCLNNIKIVQTITISPEDKILTETHKSDPDWKKIGFKKAVLVLREGVEHVGDYNIVDPTTGKFATSRLRHRGDFTEYIGAEGTTYVKDLPLGSGEKYVLTETIDVVSSDLGNYTVKVTGGYLEHDMRITSVLSLTEPDSDDTGTNDFMEELVEGNVTIYLRSGTGLGYSESDGVYTYSHDDRNRTPFHASVDLSFGTRLPRDQIVEYGAFEIIKSGTVLKEGTTLSTFSTDDDNVELRTKRIVLRKPVIEKAFKVVGGTDLDRVYLSSDKVEIQPRTVSYNAGALPYSCSFTEPIHFKTLSVTLDETEKLVLPMDLKFLKKVYCENVMFSSKSLLTAGTVFDKDLKTISGATYNENLTFETGVEFDEIFSTDAVIYTDEITSDNRIHKGTIIGGGPCDTVLKVGTLVSSDNTLPGSTTVHGDNKTTFLSGMNIVGCETEPGFMFKEGISFAGKFKFSSGSRFNKVTIPPGTKCLAGQTFGSAIQMPASYEFQVGDALPIGASFEASHRIPEFIKLDDHHGYGVIPDAELNVALVRVGTRVYVMYNRNTVFGDEKEFPIGTIFSSVAMDELLATYSSGNIRTLNTDYYDGGVWTTESGIGIELEEGEFIKGNRNQGLSTADIILPWVTPTSVSLWVVGSNSWDNAVVMIPYYDDVDIFRDVSFPRAFSLREDVVLVEKFTTDSHANFMWPAGRALLYDMVTTSESYQPVEFLLTRPMELAPAARDHFTRILSEPGSYIKMPSRSVVHECAWMCNSDIVIGTDTGVGIKLYEGNEIKATSLLDGDTLDGLLTTSEIRITKKWTVTADIIKAPKMVVCGLTLAGETKRLFGPLVCLARTRVPANLTLPHACTLANDLEVNEYKNSFYTLGNGRVLLEAGSIISRSSIVTRNMTFFDVEAKNVPYLADVGGQLGIAAGQKFPGPMTVYSYHGDTPLILTSDSNAELEDMKNTISLISQMVC
jgi:hypothetical protein